MPRLASYRDFDWVLLGFVLVLSVISVLEIKSATLHTKFHGFDQKQMGFLAVGLVPVALFGTRVMGGKRWINLHGVHFQPSEWVKLILIVAIARFFWGITG